MHTNLNKCQVKNGECFQTFRGKLSNIPGNVAKYSGESRHGIPENVTKHFGECPQTFWGMLPNIPGNVLKHSRELHKTFRRMLPMFSVN